MFGCENVKPILNSHYAQIILPLLGLCNIMSYVFWQHSPRELHLSPARPSKAAHTEHTAGFTARSSWGCGRKRSAPQKTVHSAGKHRHTQKSTYQELFLGIIINQEPNPEIEGGFHLCCLLLKIWDIHLLEAELDNSTCWVEKCYIRQCAHTVKSCTED